jgi:ribosomal protein S27AE
MDAARKNRVRVEAYYLLRRGDIARRFCEKCGDPKAEMHHDDYRLPDRVRWLCKCCHEHLHTLQNRFPPR